MPSTTSLQQKYDAILSYEGLFANRVAARLVEKPTLSVWMILIPIVLLYWLQRYQKFKAGVELVSQELLKTKRRALDLALAMKEGRPSEIPPPEQLLPGPVPDANKLRVREAERKEVALLIEHYRRLLDAEGADFRALVLDAYRTREVYQAFLARLTAAEDTVDDTVRANARGDVALLETATQLEKAVAELREEELARIFPDR